MLLSKMETIMKKRLYFIALIALILGSCEEFLDVEPTSQPTTDSFLGDPATTETNFEQMVRAAYSVFTASENSWRGNRHYFENMVPDWTADDAQKGGNGIADLPEMMDIRSWTAIPASSAGSHYSTPWVIGYLGAARANNILQQLELYKSNISETAYTRIKGESLFIRGYFYFLLAKNFGSVPYYDVPVTADAYYDQPKLSPADLYARIEADLREALSLVPLKSDFADAGIWWGGRASKGAVGAILARVITMEIGFGLNGKTWEEVYQITSGIINSNEYALLPNYAQIFEMEGEMGSESVFETPCADLGQAYGQPGGNMEQRMTTMRPDPNLIYGANTPTGGWGFSTPTANLYNQFDPGDYRRECTMLSDGDIAFGDLIPVTVSDICPTGHWLRKYQGPNPRINTSGDKNVRIVRYAEVLLTHAEAAYHTSRESEALDALNEVHERAMASTGPKGSLLGLPDAYPTTPSTLAALPVLSGQALLDAIKHERRVELGVEGIRVYDLYRWGEFQDAIRESIIPEDRFLGSMNPEEVVANFESHLIDGVVPCLPIPSDEVENFRIEQNAGY
jgi:starch-binding outer membrane protein, SusD/RagB family